MTGSALAMSSDSKVNCCQHIRTFERETANASQTPFSVLMWNDSTKLAGSPSSRQVNQLRLEMFSGNQCKL